MYKVDNLKVTALEPVYIFKLLHCPFTVAAKTYPYRLIKGRPKHITHPSYVIAGAVQQLIPLCQSPFICPSLQNQVKNP